MKIYQTLKLSRFLRLAAAVTLMASVAIPALAGSIERLIYYDANGTLSNFLATANLAEPQWQEQLDDHTPPVYGFQSKDDGQYYPHLIGSFTRGYLEAPTNGNYKFFLASYSASQLWLSTNYTVTGTNLIAFETNQGTALFSGPRLSTRESTNIALVGGQKYYVAVLQQGNSASNSYVEVGWQRPDGVQEIIPALHLAQYEDDPGYLDFTAPEFNQYGYNGGNLPSTAATNEDSTLIVESDVIAVQPTTFQWYRNGTLVTNQNLSYLNLSPVHAVDNNAQYYFVVTNIYGALTSSVVTLSITPNTTPPAVTSVDTLGNPNGVTVSFSKTLKLNTVTNLANYALQIQGGASLVITSATLLASQQTVLLTGNFNFQLGTTYQLTVSGIQDQDTTPNNLSPNPTIGTFVYAPPAGTTYTFSDGTGDGFSLFGSANEVANGGYAGGGYVDLTDASTYEAGVLQFSNSATVEQFELDFKARIGGAGAVPGDGFSINLAADLPQGTFVNQQEGYAPIASPGANPLVVAFNNDRTVNGVVSPAITVEWQGNLVTNVLTGIGGVPPINSADGHWADVNLQLQRGGNLSLSFDGVVIFTNLATGFVPVQNAQLEVAAETSANYETHWISDLYINYNNGGVGPVGFATNPSLTNLTVLENQTATFAVIPSGASPDYYQWYFNGTAIPNANSSVLSVDATLVPTDAAGQYSVVVSNWFSVATSAAATLSITPDTTPLQLVSASILDFGNNQVVLSFSKPVSLATATNLATYNLGLLPLYSAALSANGLSVTLNTGVLERNQLYLFTIKGLQDTTAEANTLNITASFVASAASAADYASQVLADGAIRYWRFDDPVGSLTAASIATGADPITSDTATLDGNPTLGIPSLIPSEPQDPALGLSSVTGDYLTSPNGVDISSAGPYAQRTVEFWFNAESLPAPGSTALSAANGLYSEGAATRGLDIYLWRDPANPNPDTAALIFNAWNNASDGAGAPWGTTSAGTTPESSTTPSVYAETTVQAGLTYHVVAVLNGGTVTPNGQLILYVNGVPVSTANGAGQLYAHTGNSVNIGRINGLLHTGDSGTSGTFSGVLDDLSLYDVALSASTVALHYQEGTNTVNLAVTNSAPLAVSRLDTLGNPNSVVLTFNEPISKASATNLTHYALKNWAGAAITITNATLLGGQSSVQLLGNFGFLINSNYTLTVSAITNALVANNILAPNPTTEAFAFAAPTGTTYTFSNGLPVGLQIAGAAYVTNSGGYAGDGFIDLTDAATNENGVVLFSDRHDVSQIHVNFNALLSNGSTPPGSGFSVNIAPDLKPATFSNPQLGYLATPLTNRLTIAFNNLSNTPSISVLLWGTNVTKVLVGTNGFPTLNNTNGQWANVDIQLQLNGLLSVSYGGVTVITNLGTGFQPILGAQVSFAAGTTASAYETHWFDDININYDQGSVGPVYIPTNGQPQNTIVLENATANLAVVPAGTDPYGYQWYYTNTPVAGATNRTYAFAATTNNAGAYKVVVRNNFSSVTSQVATVSVQLDQNPAAVTNIAAYAGGVNQVQIQFNKQLDPVTATSLLTYYIPNLPITNATLSSSGSLVTLFTTQQQNLQTNTLTITGLRNYAAQPHILNTNVAFTSGISFDQEALVDGPVRHYRFTETNGTTVNSDISILDPLSTAQGTTYNNPVLAVAPLFTNASGRAIQLNHANTNYITFPAAEYDITWTNTGAPHYWAQKSIEIWFKANSLPYAGTYTDTNGNTFPTNHAYGLWSEGANSRYLNIYLYGIDNTTTNPSQALLVVSGGNIANDGPGAYQQWGTLAGGGPAFAVYAEALVTTDQVYQVVGELNGAADTNAATLGNPLGDIQLYVNGVLADLSDDENNEPAGLLYAHDGTTVRVGQGGTNFRFDGYSFSPSDTFDGVIGDIVYYNTLLSSNRIAAHYQAALTPPLVPPQPAVVTPPVFGSYSVAGGSFGIAWSGTAQLQRATNASGPFITVTNATSPYHEPATNKQVFFRLVH